MHQFVLDKTRKLIEPNPAYRSVHLGGEYTGTPNVEQSVVKVLLANSALRRSSPGS
jgi:hypothetical protein